MEKDTKKKIVVGAGLLTGAGLAYLLTRRAGTAPPPPPPPSDDVGLLQGYILDATTNEKLPPGTVKITIDHDQTIYNNLDSRGGYRTSYLSFGMHHFSVQADNHVIGEFDIEISQTLLNYNFVLEPLPQAPTPWTEGVTVETVRVDKPTAYLGEVVHILIDIQYAYPAPLPADISGTVLVDGQELTGEWTIDFRNPTLGFTYTTTHPGIFTVRAQNKSTTFEVVRQVPGTYYLPFGGTRMPVCTEVVVPSVEPFTAWPDIRFDGGDYIMSGYGLLKVPPRIGWLGFPIGAVEAIVGRLPDAYPTVWDAGTVNDWSTYILSQQGAAYLLVVAADYTCPPYWNSKAELAEMIARWGPNRPPNGYEEAIAEYGNIDPVRGIRDQVQPIEYIIPGYGRSDSIKCPYCDGNVGQTKRPYPHSNPQYLTIARKLLEHIESVHPNHPLTQPAWF